MKNYYLILLIINVFLIVILIAVAINQCWKIHILYILLSPIVAFIVIPFIRLMDDD